MARSAKPHFALRGFRRAVRFASVRTNVHDALVLCVAPIIQELSKRVGAGVSRQNDVALVSAFGTDERNPRAIFEILSLQNIPCMALWTQNIRHCDSMFHMYH
jgi:hypothetical protein